MSHFKILQFIILFGHKNTTKLIHIFFVSLFFFSFIICKQIHGNYESTSTEDGKTSHDIYCCVDLDIWNYFIMSDVGIFYNVRCEIEWWRNANYMLCGMARRYNKLFISRICVSFFFHNTFHFSKWQTFPLDFYCVLILW
jgi:hypothetical protein